MVGYYFGLFVVCFVAFGFKGSKEEEGGEEERGGEVTASLVVEGFEWSEYNYLLFLQICWFSW